jgi:hypothetical protein
MNHNLMENPSVSNEVEKTSRDQAYVPQGWQSVGPCRIYLLTPTRSIDVGSRIL